MKDQFTRLWIPLLMFIGLATKGTPALAQTDVEFVEFKLEANGTADSLRVLVRITGPTNFSGSINELKYTIRWIDDPLSNIAIDPAGLTQFCQTGYDIQYYQQTPLYSGGYAYATMNAFGLPPMSNACPDQVWQIGTWKLIQAISVMNIGFGCTEFEIVNDLVTVLNGRESYIELLGQEIPHSIEPTPAIIGDCNVPCDAVFEIVQSTNGNVLIPFTFHIVNSSSGVGPITYSWDNIPSTDAEPSYVIQSDGEDFVYTLCLTIIDADGCGTQSCDTVYVDTNGIIYQDPPIPCVPEFLSEQTAPFTVQLTSASTAFGLSGANWILPNAQSQSGDSITYTFNGAGTYEICMTPIGYGCGSICQTFTVNANGVVSTQACEAGYWLIQAFEYDAMGDVIPIPYHLWVWNISVGNGNMDLLWDFGDGNTSTEQFPMHIYGGSGPYELCLTIADGSGCTDTFCDSLNIQQDGLLGMMPGGNDRNSLTINVLPNMPLGMLNSPAAAEISAWPNPATELLNISMGRNFTGSTRVSIMDQHGRIVRIMDSSFKFSRGTITVPVADLANGMYMIRIENDGTSIAQRFVKH